MNIDDQKVLDLAEKHLLGVDLEDPNILLGLKLMLQEIRPAGYVLVPEEPYKDLTSAFHWKNVEEGYREMITRVKTYHANQVLWVDPN